MRELSTDILILGSGGAGLFAALHAHQADPSLSITVAVKGLLGKCGCTRMVQGGYNVALAPGDSIERHFMDTIEGGKWLPDQELAWKLVTLAVERIRELENELGCFFDRNPDGSIHQKAFAGQTFDRTVHKGDLTGIEIINRLAEQVWARNIGRLEEHRAVELVKTKAGDALAGVLMIDMRTGEYALVRAKAVLLATGGGPTMYKYHTPSGDKSCDGLAMALRAGLALRDMEMVQFHPTGLLAGTHTRMTGTVLEEGLRGSGGYLLNGAKERFMQDYDPKLERATRDIVSRSMVSEMRAGRVTPNGGLYIAMAHLGPERVRREFKGMVERCADCGFDLAGGLVEVVPTAHYMMGGVEFNLDCSTALPGLFVAGEDAGGVHGANRLGGNGVANSTVFGAVAGDVMAAWARKEGALREADREAVDAAIGDCEQPLKGAAGPHGALEEVRERLFELMWNKVGVIREGGELQSAADELSDIDSALDAHVLGANTDRAFNLSWHDWMNLKSLVATSRAITAAAQARDDSRGAHFRSDYPEAGPLERSAYTSVRSVGGRLEIAMKPVEFSRVKPGETLLDKLGRMPLSHIEHFLVAADNQEATRDWYRAVLGMEEGPHPDFGFPVYWMYLDGKDVVHIGPSAAKAGEIQKKFLGRTSQDTGVGTGALDHIAFRATGLRRMLEHLRAHGIAFTQRRANGQALFQLFLYDPNGIKVELNFAAVEAEGIDAELMASELIGRG